MVWTLRKRRSRKGSVQAVCSDIPRKYNAFDRGHATRYACCKPIEYNHLQDGSQADNWFLSESGHLNVIMCKLWKSESLPFLEFAFLKHFIWFIGLFCVVVVVVLGG